MKSFVQKNDVYENVHSNYMQSSPRVDTAHWSISRWIDEPTTDYSHHGTTCWFSATQSCATPWTEARQASLSLSLSSSLLRLMSTELVMPSSYLILSHPLLLLPSIFPSIKFFHSELAFHIRWPKCWSFSFRICPSSEYSG